MERKFITHSKNFSVVDYPSKGAVAVFSEDTMRFFLIQRHHWDEFYQMVLAAHQEIKKEENVKPDA